MYSKYRESVIIKEHNLSILNEIKNKFKDDSSIEINEWKSGKKSIDIVTKRFSTLKMNSTYLNNEYIQEMKRRAEFNFYYRLKYVRINFTEEMRIFSFTRDKFIAQNVSEMDWQKTLFGIDRPHIVMSLNHNVKDQLPEVANGYIGINGFKDEVQMQSLFSGSFMQTHRASIPSWTILNITAVYDLNGNNLVVGRRLQLDMSNGRLLQILYSHDCIVEQQIYAHQTLKSLIVHEIQVQFTKDRLNVIVLKLPKDRKRDVSSNIHISEISENTKYIKIISGVTHVNDQKNHEQHIHAYYHSVPDEIRINKSKKITKYYYLMSVNENKDVARKDFDQGMTWMEDNNLLFTKHDLIWRKIWTKSGVFMKRSNVLDVQLISAQYLINSNLPNIGREETYGAMGATGLGVVSNQGAGHSLMTNCGGRIEYSQELWILNSQMLLHSQSVKSIINKRISQIPKAKTNAEQYIFKGVKFPAATNELGEELCTDQATCSNMHFPTGLVSLAMSKYLFASGDITMFTNQTVIGALMEINAFWKSLLKKYEQTDIESVPLSNLNLNVKNAAFEIGLIKESLLLIPTMYDFFKLIPTTEFGKYILELDKLSKSISIPFDAINNFHPPYKEFDVKHDKVYFPDGVMLRYPLDHLVDIELSVRNLVVYERRLFEPINPMSYSMLFINNIEADRITQAENNLGNLLSFCDNHFKVWSNNSRIWIGSYIPAAAAYLDSVLFGLVGIRIRRSGLYMLPKLIGNVSNIAITNLEYLGSRIKVIVDIKTGISLQIVSTKRNAWKLGVMDIVKNSSNALDGIVTFPLKTELVIRRLKSK